MTPTPSDANSPLATLRQLKEMLDAGTITPQEFNALKQQLIPGLASLPAAGIAEGPAAPAGLHTEPVEVPFAPPATPAPLASPPPLTPPPAPAASYPTPYLDTPGALTPEATPLLAPEPDWLPAPAPLPGENQLEAAAPTEATERRNPLNLIFAIGGLLLFLAVVGYLASTRTSNPDEHLTSTSQTAADSTTAAAPEVGPQAEQLTLPPAAPPETVRVAPTPAPTPAATPLATDSAATPTATPATAPPAASPASTPAAATPKAAAPKAAVPKPAPAPAADTAASRP